MIKINSTRLQSIVDDYKECLQETIEDYDICINLTESDKYYRQLRSAFRDDIKNLYTILEDYLAYSLKTVGVGVSDRVLKDCIDIAVKLSVLDEDFGEFYSSSVGIRNTFSHQYKKPTTKMLLKFFKDNKEKFMDFEKFIDKKLEKSLLDSQNTKNIFEVKK